MNEDETSQHMKTHARKISEPMEHVFVVCLGFGVDKPNFFGTSSKNRWKNIRSVCAAYFLHLDWCVQ